MLYILVTTSGKSKIQYWNSSGNLYATKALNLAE